MFPSQIRKAIDDNLPVAFPVGVLEYHSEHCCVGVDGILVIRALEILEREMRDQLILLPPFYWGTAGYVVEKPERNGSINVGAEAVFAVMKDIFLALLRVGFRNIHVIIHHQTENFVNGMPTDLALKFASRTMIFKFLESERGEGWWGNKTSQDYYNAHAGGENPFNWIKVHPFMDDSLQRSYPIDHAGEQETSLMLAFCPEGVGMERWDEEKWYSEGAAKASLHYGNAMKTKVLEYLRKIIRTA